MRRRTLVLAVCAWAALVVVASVATWTVIDSVGRDVLARGSVPAAADWPSTRPPRTPAGDATAPRPRRVPTSAPTGAAPTRGPAAAPSPSATVPRPAAPPVPRTRPTPTPSAPRATHRPATPAPTATEQGSWQGRAGTVVAECTGARISLRSATPSDGYRVETGSRGPQEVEVSFHGGDDRGQAQVKGVCRAGAPSFGAQTAPGDD